MANPAPIAGIQYPTQIEVAKSYGPEGKELVPFIAALNQDNMNLYVEPYIPGNTQGGFLSEAENYMPLPSAAADGQGQLPNFNSSQQNFDTYARVPDVFEIPVSVLDEFKDKEYYRLRQVMGRIRAMGHKVAQMFFYSSLAVNPLEFNGLEVRYNHLSTTNSPTALNTISAGGTNASVQTSVFLVGFSPDSCTGIFNPHTGTPGTYAGFHHIDAGIVDLSNAPDPNGGSVGRMRVYRDYFEYKGGLAVPDWRFVLRGCNFDTTDLSSTNPQTDVKYWFEEMLGRIPNSNNVPYEPGISLPRPTFWWFFNRSMKRYLGHNLLNTMIAGAGIRSENVRNPENQYMGAFEYGGVPAGICDTITDTEAIVGN